MDAIRVRLAWVCVKQASGCPDQKNVSYHQTRRKENRKTLPKSLLLPTVHPDMSDLWIRSQRNVFNLEASTQATIEMHYPAESTIIIVCKLPVRSVNCLAVAMQQYHSSSGTLLSTQ